MRRFLCVVGAVASFLLSGCGGDGKLKVYPVKGQVLYNGQPLKRVDVAFHPLDPKNNTGYPPHAVTDDEGRFALMTYVKEDGAPAGEWKVCVAFAIEASDDGSDQAKKLKFQVPSVYQRKETTPFTVKVEAQANILEPLNLQGPPMPTK